MRLSGHREVGVAQDRPEGISVAFGMSGRIAGELRCTPRIGARVLDDDLGRLFSMAVQELIRRLLVPREPAPAAFQLEQELVLPARPEGAEDCRPNCAVLEAKQQRSVILERAAGNEGTEVGEHLRDEGASHVLCEIEPVRAEVRGHVGRARALSL